MVTKLAPMNTAPQRGGTVLVMFAIMLVVLCGAAALTVDLGNTRDQSRLAQNAVDAAALAGARLVGRTPDDELAQEARALAQANGLTENDGVIVLCGRWQGGAFAACDSGGGGAACLSCSDSSANAVRVSARRQVGMVFAQLLGVEQLAPAVEATAMMPILVLNYCMRPFGVELRALDGVNEGDLFTVGSDAPGNWGKLDIGGNMSSGTNFENAMVNGICNADVALGASIETGTGFGGSIRNVMNEVVQQGSENGMVIGLVSPFPNGNGQVTLEEFITVDYVRQSNSGGNWQGTFRLVERNTAPPQSSSTAGGGVVLVK